MRTTNPPTATTSFEIRKSSLTCACEKDQLEKCATVLIKQRIVWGICSLIFSRMYLYIYIYIYMYMYLFYSHFIVLFTPFVAVCCTQCNSLLFRYLGRPIFRRLSFRLISAMKIYSCVEVSWNRNVNIWLLVYA